ncbi:MAG: glycosyltransferase family 2 protein [Oscillospiraceae bacterium]|nr:glycosyltransferase family 2 protein [Oscillospiraceae bacterium]
MDLSVIIINYNTKLLTEKTIELFIQTADKDLKYEIILVDNSSEKDQKIFKIDGVCKIIDSENNGFGSGCNLGVKNSIGRYILFLNSDVEFKNNKLLEAIRYIEKNQDIGILGGKMVLSDGSLDHGCKRGFPTPFTAISYFLKLDKIFKKSKIFGKYRLTYMSDDELNYVDCVSGGLMVIKRSVYDQLDGFDEDYFMYGEDIDICYRANQKGYKTVYFPKISVLHLKGQSGLNTKSKITIKRFYDSMLIFYKKNYKDKYNILLYYIVYIGIKLKKLISSI